MELPEYLYSLDSEYFHEWDYIEDEVVNEYEPESDVTIFRGVPVPVTHLDYLKSTGLINYLIDIAADVDGEMSEEYLQDVTKEQEEQLIQFISEKMVELGIKQPNFTRVGEIEEIKFKW